MGDKWELYQNYWQTTDDDSPATDASLAEDSFIEDAIMQMQEQFKKLTDMLVALSAERTKTADQLRKLKEAVIIAYSYVRAGDVANAQRELERVVR